MKTRTIVFVKDFTDSPGGRLRIHGDHSGEEFRDDVLKPALLEHDEVHLDLNGAFGFPSSFIDEAFGILVEHLGFDAVDAKLHILLDDDPLAFAEITEAMSTHRKAATK